jgi:hypothetical protein
MNKYTFPFNSCEIPHKNGIAQPYSTAINIFLCSVILLFLLQSNNIYSTLFLTSILLFNIFHTFSHMIHIDNYENLQFLLTHFSAIFSTIIFIFLLSHITKKNINLWYFCILFLLYFTDILLVIYNSSHTYNITIFIIILISIMLYFYKYVSNTIKTNIIYIIFFSCVVLSVQVFEIFNCNNLLLNYGNFPFHTITETTAFIPIFLLCYTFYKV